MIYSESSNNNKEMKVGDSFHEIMNKYCSKESDLNFKSSIL